MPYSGWLAREGKDIWTYGETDIWCFPAFLETVTAMLMGRAYVLLTSGPTGWAVAQGSQRLA